MFFVCLSCQSGQIHTLLSLYAVGITASFLARIPAAFLFNRMRERVQPLPVGRRQILFWMCAFLVFYCLKAGYTAFKYKKERQIGVMKVIVKKRRHKITDRPRACSRIWKRRDKGYRRTTSTTRRVQVRISQKRFSQRKAG